MSTNSAESSGAAELRRRFPAMTPVQSPPSLFTLNGFGISVFGKRDPDAASGTYIKTRCLCALFIPLFPLDAYRVADAPGGGWYFLGKEKVSRFARAWRGVTIATIAILAASGAWSVHVNSPAYRARKAKETATSLAAKGEALKAADVYRDVLRQGIGDRDEWRLAMESLVKGEIAAADPARAAAAIRYADQHKVVPGLSHALIPDLADQALAAAARCGDPAAAASILSSFTPVPTDLKRVHEALRKALESLHAATPDDHETRIKLALMREEFGEVEGALGLLEPAADKLGDGEGARLFGNLLLGEGRVAEAMRHLEHYVTPRLAKWKSAESAVESSYQAAQQAALNRLNGSGGPPGFKKRYEAASEAEQERMVGDYLAKEVERDRNFLAAKERYQEAAAIVPAIMDLGVARLRMAQETTDPDVRKGLLKQAEEAFLTLKDVAGESDEFRLFLGQIYFWSGREPEGRKLFDELLAAKKRDFATLYGLADIFRDLGENDDARRLLEEAFGKAANDQERSVAARLRSLLAKDTDEKIEWLSKDKSGSPQLAINLAEARGEKAEEQGDVEAAKRHYRDALARYGTLKRDSANLNNSALLHRSLYRLEGKTEDFEAAARLVSEAVELEPANSILSSNAADSQLTAAVVRLAGDRVHPKLLQFDSGASSLRYLYQRQEEKEKIVAALKADPNFRKALSHYWDALLLAPKNVGLYGWGAAVFAYIDDRESLEKLVKKATEQEFDFTSRQEELERFRNKERDSEIREGLKAHRDRVAAIAAQLDDPRSQALVQGCIAEAHIGGFGIGEPTGWQNWLGKLKAAAKDAPCSRLQTDLEVALEVVAMERLAADFPDCAALIDANRRLLTPQDILRLLVRARGDLGERVRKHPAVIEAREVASATEALFPLNFALDDWLLLEGLHPERDARLKELVAANRTELLTDQLARELQKEGPNDLLDQFWAKVFEGDATGARELLPKIEAAQVKLPPLF